VFVLASVLDVTVTQFGFQDFFTTFALGATGGSAVATGRHPGGDALGTQDLLSRGRSVVSTGLTETVDTAVCGILGNLR